LAARMHAAGFEYTRRGRSSSCGGGAAGIQTRGDASHDRGPKRHRPAAQFNERPIAPGNGWCPLPPWDPAFPGAFFLRCQTLCCLNLPLGFQRHFSSPDPWRSFLVVGSRQRRTKGGRKTVSRRETAPIGLKNAAVCPLTPNPSPTRGEGNTSPGPENSRSAGPRGGYS
jgi:hypothetical protein